MRINTLLGEFLIERKLITPDQLKKALADQKESKEPLGQVLIRHGAIEEDDLRAALSEQLGVSFLSATQLKPRTDQRLKECVPMEFARQHQVLPLERTGRMLKVAVGRAPDVIFLDNLRKSTGYDILTVLSTESELKRAIDQYYGSVDFQEVLSSSEVSAATVDYTETQKDENKMDLEAVTAEAGKGPVVRLVDLMMKKALDDRASDIHIEPYGDKLTIRYRVDGSLYELPPPPRELHNAVVSRIKILSKLDISEKRIPQDGSFSLQYQGRKIDVRVSTIPVLYGEKVVMRILDKRMDLLDMSLLGLETDQLKQFETALNRPYGLIFATGPTGLEKARRFTRLSTSGFLRRSIS